MGTTQRISPGVTGEPNWGDLSRSITSISRSVENEKEVAEDEERLPKDEIEKRFKQLLARRDKHLKAAVKHLIRTGGGAKTVSSGKSKSFGRAGMKSAQKITAFFSDVALNGLQHELERLGFGSLEGKTVKGVVDFLLIYVSEESTGMDETAANKASCQVLNEIVDLTGNDLDSFEEFLKQTVDEDGLNDLLCRFWGFYVFEHLSQRFEEKITQKKGEAISKETFKIIREDILGRIKVINEQQSVSKINWRGNEGKRQIESIFKSILNILSDED